VYGMPDIEGRGLKIAFDEHGERVDPDTQSRIVLPRGPEMVRKLWHGLPRLARCANWETRVCQYENTSNGDFLIDRHPGMENVWFAGGGSGHGFKHGPSVGSTSLASCSTATAAEARFSLATKDTVQRRAVY